MTTTVWPAVVDSILAGLRALDGHTSPDVAPSTGVVVVYDAGQPAEVGGASTTEYEGEPILQWVSVGWPGDPGGDQVTCGTTTQSPRALAAGTRPQTEEASVSCVVEASWGDAEPARCRRAAFAELAEVEAWVRGTSPALGTSGVQWAGVGDIEVDQGSGPDGVWCRLTFKITYKARLG